MRKATQIIILLLLVSVCSLGFGQSWQVEYKVPDTNTAEQWIRAHFRITNNSGASVPMTELTMRYWYTVDSPSDEVLQCFWAQVGTANVSATFTTVSPAVTGADKYCAIAFSAAAGSLANGSNSGEIQVGWHKTSWTNYNETDDYSHDLTKTSYAAWDRVTLYRNGVLVWGTEPVSGPEPTPTSVPTATPTATPEGTPTATPTATPYSTPTATPTATPYSTPTATPTTTPYSTPTATPESTPTATPDITPTPGQGGQAILLEAEDYTAFYDTTSGNQGNTYRTDDVDIESCAEGGYNVGYVIQGEWLEYPINVTTTDTFNIYVRVASPTGKTQGYYISIDGVDATGWIAVPNTGAWQSWNDAMASAIPINSGAHTLRIFMNGDFNLNYIYLASSSNPPGPTTPPGALPTSTPPAGYQSIVSQYGQLQVIGKNLCNQSGTPVRLKGMGSHGLQWFPFMADHTIHNLVYDWKIQVIRPAMYIEDYKNGDYWGGYVAQPEYMKGKLVEMIQDALDVGIYVLIDWHIHNDPNNFTALATAFYQEMATTYGGYPNVIYEICNEPENVSWASVKTYANTLIPVIRAIDPDNIIIVGSQNWCQDLDVTAASPLTGYTNIMYSLHFYAGTHGQNIRDKANVALAANLPVIVTEWGTSDSTGGSNGVNYFPESDTWVAWMNQNNLTWINWNFSNKSESSAALKPGVNIGGPWADADITPSGIYIRNLLTN